MVKGRAKLIVHLLFFLFTSFFVCVCVCVGGWGEGDSFGLASLKYISNLPIKNKSCFSADSLDSYQAQCWMETVAVFSFCLCLSDFWEVESLWTTCVSNIYSELYWNNCTVFFHISSAVELQILFWNHLNHCINHLNGWYWLQEDGEDEGRTLRMGKRLLRSLALVFSCIAVSSLVCDPIQIFWRKFKSMFL